MKLFCSSKLQKMLQCKCEKVPLPDNVLDRWYANLVEMNGADTVVAILPDFRFCALLWNVPLDPFTDLSQLLVPAIRKALLDPLYGIPLSVVNRYIPEGTEFELCTSADRSFTARTGAATNQVLNRGYYLPAFFDDFDPLQTQHAINRAFLGQEGGKVPTRWEAVKSHLLQQYGWAVSAMELEVSLDLQQYVLKRTLVVPDDITFGTLHLYLEKACFWKSQEQLLFSHLSEGDADVPIHRFIPLAGKPRPWGDNLRLSDCLKKGDCFRYVYATAGSKNPWELDIRVRRHIPSAQEELPVCTECQGKSPPDWVDGVKGFQEFCKVLENPDDPRCAEYAHKIGIAWIIPVEAKDVTRGLRTIGIFP